MRSTRFILLLLFGVFSAAAIAAAGELAEPPDGEQYRNAKKIVTELFAAEMAKANKPAEKVKLAKEFLKVADKVKSQNAQSYVLYCMARSYAVEGRDQATAFDAAIGLARAFKPNEALLSGLTADLPASERYFEKAQEFWKSASKVRGPKRLELQVKAAEWYAYALPGLDGIEKLLAEKRLKVEKIASHSRPWLIYADKTEWQHTIKVKRGERITIKASGTWNWGLGKTANCGPNGESDRGFGWLECRIGGGRPFKVGEEISFIATAGGILSLRMKDDNCSDNSGCLKVVIETSRRYKRR